MTPTRGPVRKKPPKTWSAFNEGDLVTVYLGSGFTMEGRIDTVHPEGETVWILLDDGSGRRLFHFQDDVTIMAHET